MKVLGRKIKRVNNKTETTFLVKLFTILKDDKFSNFIYWSEDGLSIIIPNQNTFIKKVLPKFCNTRNYSSFVRQLNMYNFKKIKTANRGEQKYRHDEFNKFKTEDQIKLIKKKTKSKQNDVQEIQINSYSYEQKLGENIMKDNVEDKILLDKIEQLGEESKIKEYEKIIKKGELSNLRNEKILNYLLDKSKENIENKKYFEEELKNIIIQNNNLMEQIEIYNTKLTLQNNNNKQMYLLLAYLLFLLFSKKKTIYIDEKEEKKKYSQILIDKLSEMKKKNLGSSENEGLKNFINNYLKFSQNINLAVQNTMGSSCSRRNNSIIVRDNNFFINQDIFNNNIKYHNNDNNDLSNISFLKTPYPYYDYKSINIKNSMNSSLIFPDKTNISNNFNRYSLNNISNSNL